VLGLEQLGHHHFQDAPMNLDLPLAIDNVDVGDREAIEEVYDLKPWFAPLVLQRQCISLVGVVQYFGLELSRRLDPEKTFRVLRSAEALAGAAKRRGWIPLLDRHPKLDVDTATNSELERYLVGRVSDMTFDGRHLRASVMVSRPDAVAAIKAGERSALSISYIHDLAIEDGSFDDMPYDAIARDILVTSVALVENSRAGDAVRISIPEMV
jgi:hypothetical protein